MLYILYFLTLYLLLWLAKADLNLKVHPLCYLNRSQHQLQISKSPPSFVKTL